MFRVVTNTRTYKTLYKVALTPCSNGVVHSTYFWHITLPSALRIVNSLIATVDTHSAHGIATQFIISERHFRLCRTQEREKGTKEAIFYLILPLGILSWRLDRNATLTHVWFVRVQNRMCNQGSGCARICTLGYNFNPLPSSRVTHTRMLTVEQLLDTNSDCG